MTASTSCPPDPRPLRLPSCASTSPPAPRPPTGTTLRLRYEIKNRPDAPKIFAPCQEFWTRARLGDLAPGQLVLDTETKTIHHAIKIAAFNTTTAIARDVRLHTGYARAAQEAYTLTRQALTQTGDILPDPTAGTLTIRLDPLPTARETAAIAELCEHLTATKTT